MDVELLVIPDCPHEGTAHELLRRTLDEVGLGHIGIRTTVIATDEAARDRGFAGSPSFSVNGLDLFADHAVMPAVSCRMYRTSAGLAPLPDVLRLRQLLRQAAQAGTAAGE